MNILVRLLVEFGQPMAWLAIVIAAIFLAFAGLAVVAGLRALFTSSSASRNVAMEMLRELLDLFRRRRP